MLTSNNIWDLYDNIRNDFSILEKNQKESDIDNDIHTKINSSCNISNIENNKNIKPSDDYEIISTKNSEKKNITNEEITNKNITNKEITNKQKNINTEDFYSNDNFISSRIENNKQRLRRDLNNEEFIAEIVDDLDLSNNEENKITLKDIKDERQRLDERDEDFKRKRNGFISKDLYVNKNICDLCKMETMIHDDLKYVCIECGFINFQLISTSGECNDFSNSSGKNEGVTTRYGLINPLLPQSSRATTMLSYGGKGGKSYIARMQEWYNMPYSEKSLLEIFHLIDRKCIEDNLPTIIRDRSKLMFKILKDENILKREKPKHALIAACIYYACKEKGIPKTTKELSNLFDINITQMTTGCKQFNEIMYYNNLDFLITIKPITYIECINSMCYMLDIEDRYKTIITNIAKVADRIGIVNDNIPPSIAVSAIYLFIVMMDLPISKKVLSKKSKISEVTISKTYKKLFPYRKYLLTMKCL